MTKRLTLLIKKRNTIEHLFLRRFTLQLFQTVILVTPSESFEKIKLPKRWIESSKRCVHFLLIPIFNYRKDEHTQYILYGLRSTYFYEVVLD